MELKGEKSMSFRFNPITGKFDLVGAGATQIPNYITTFNMTTDWGTAVGGCYEIDIPATTHGKGLNPLIQVLELNGSTYEMVTTTIEVDQVSGDIKLSTLESPDTRFAGKIVIAENN